MCVARAWEKKQKAGWVAVLVWHNSPVGPGPRREERKTGKKMGEEGWVAGSWLHSGLVQPKEREKGMGERGPLRWACNGPNWAQLLSSFFIA